MPGKSKKKSASNILEMQNAANTLFANIRFQSVDEPVKTILLTSCIPSEGKSTTAMLLAQAIASAGNRTLIVECDMRRRSMSAMLNVHSSAGLYAVMTGEARLSQAVVPTQVPNLYFLDAEPGIPSPADLLASNRMAQTVTQLRRAFDYVVFDTPPVGTFIDAAVLARLVDGCILVVRPNGPKRSELVAAYEQMLAADANMLGICSTFEAGSGSEYYYAYYTKSGKRVKKGAEATGVRLTGSVTPARQMVQAAPQPAVSTGTAASNNTDADSEEKGSFGSTASGNTGSNPTTSAGASGPQRGRGTHVAARANSTPMPQSRGRRG